ncbi:hypothetical protein ACFLQG_00960 [Candidatus Zixiibacteriota bacterium]
MIWIKRALPLVIIIAVWLGYGFYDDYQEGKTSRTELKYAEVTALVWVASAKFRNEPDNYISYRDSLLSTYQLDVEKCHQFIDAYQENPEKLGNFAFMVKTFIDSIIAIEDSIRLLNNDSTVVDDSLRMK